MGNWTVLINCMCFETNAFAKVTVLKNQEIKYNKCHRSFSFISRVTISGVKEKDSIVANFLLQCIAHGRSTGQKQDVRSRVL